MTSSPLLILPQIVSITGNVATVRTEEGETFPVTLSNHWIDEILKAKPELKEAA